MSERGGGTQIEEALLPSPLLLSDRLGIITARHTVDAPGEPSSVQHCRCTCQPYEGGIQGSETELFSQISDGGIMMARQAREPRVGAQSCSGGKV